MLNNGVHWASDYPLGIWLGYAFGKMAVRKGRQKKIKTADSYLGIFSGSINGGFGGKATYHFTGLKENHDDPSQLN